MKRFRDESEIQDEEEILQLEEDRSLNKGSSSDNEFDPEDNVKHTRSGRLVKPSRNPDFEYLIRAMSISAALNKREQLAEQAIVGEFTQLFVKM